MPLKINSFYYSPFFKGLAIKVLKCRAFSISPRVYEANVEWYRQDEKTKHWISMDVNQDMKIALDAIGKEWKELSI